MSSVSVLAAHTTLQRNNQSRTTKCNASCFTRAEKVPDRVRHVLLSHGLTGIHWSLPFINVMFFVVIYQKQYVRHTLSDARV